MLFRLRTSIPRVLNSSTPLFNNTTMMIQQQQRANFSSTPYALISYVKSKATIPTPTAEIPDVATFLKKIGRGCEEQAENFASWEEFMKADGYVMKGKGIDVRTRRYILNWKEKFAKGETELCTINRGKKSWGGERRRKATKAEFLAKKYREEHHRRLKEEAEN